MKHFASFILPAILIIIGFSLWCLGIKSFVDYLQTPRVALSVPGTNTINIRQAGEYLIWHQTKGLVDGRFKTFPDDPPAEMVLHAVKKSDGTEVPMRAAMKSFLESNRTRRVPLAVLTFPEAGQYEVVISGLAEKHVMYLKQVKVLRSALTCIANGIGGFFFVLAGIGSGIFVLIRNASKKRPPNPLREGTMTSV